MKRQWSTVLVIALTLLVVIFAVMNVDPVSINFGFTLVSIPLVVVIIGTLLIGMTIVAMWSTTLVLRERRQQQKIQAQLDNYELESTKKRDELTQSHLQEKKDLEAQIQSQKTENRELKRRIHNMQTSQMVKANKENEELE